MFSPLLMILFYLHYTTDDNLKSIKLHIFGHVLPQTHTHARIGLFFLPFSGSHTTNFSKIIIRIIEIIKEINSNAKLVGMKIKKTEFAYFSLIPTNLVSHSCFSKILPFQKRERNSTIETTFIKYFLKLTIRPHQQYTKREQKKKKILMNFFFYHFTLLHPIPFCTTKTQ